MGQVSLHGKHLLGLQHATPEEIKLILDVAKKMKKVVLSDDKKIPYLKGKAIINLFMEPSTRTRSSFELAGKYLGADVINITPSGSSMGKGESFRDTALRTMGRDVFLTSVNALAQTGEMVNIDGTGNRVAASLFGSQEVFFVLGRNKITPDLASAIYRARNVAAPLNSKKNKKSSLNPCAKLEEKCYDCGSPDRICNALTIYYKKMRNMQIMEVIIINEDLGF